MVNDPYAKACGRTVEECIGKTDLDLFPEEMAKGYMADDQEVCRSGQKMQVEEAIATPEGVKWHLTYKTPIFNEQGLVVGTTGIAQDITERKQAEELLQAINSELEHRVERRTLELQHTQKQYLHAEKLSAIGKLSASIAHEFNNPLQGIQSVLKGLKKRAVLEAEDRQLLEEAIEESNRIRDLIRDLQDFNRPSSSTKRFLDIHKTLDAILLLHKNDFKEKRISLVRDYAEQLPQIEAVSDQIKQVFLNMLTNAADTCLQPGGVITVSTRLENQEKVAVAIKDNGIGIKPSDRDLIFQPFFTTKSEVKGTGLGLSVSHGIIANHQGEIHVESELGKGTTFTILLPIKGAAVTS
jgi:PAS domain S-box-containing protein